MRLVLLGPPGSGKGTQGEYLAQAYRVPHIATGDLVRDHIARKTEFGRKVEAAIAAGNFAPDADIIYWVRERLSRPDTQNGFIFDGFPRDLAQAEAFDVPLDAVVDLVIALPELVERLAGRWMCPVCGEVYHSTHHPPVRAGVCDRDGAPLERRPDDEPEAVRHRLNVYEMRTLPLRAYYQEKGLLVSVNAQGEAEQVRQRIISLLNDRVSQEDQV